MTTGLSEFKLHPISEKTFAEATRNIALDTMTSCYYCHLTRNSQKQDCQKCFSSVIDSLNKITPSYKNIKTTKLYKRDSKYYFEHGRECIDGQIIAIVDCFNNVEEL